MERLYSLQYLRALAALAVVALHAGNRVIDALPVNVSAVLALGHAGVDLFFVISGFIMWTIGRTSSYGPIEFLLRRAIRVLPLYWLATLAWIAVAIIADFRWIILTPDHVVLSLLLVPHFSPSYPGEIWPVLVPGWTLSFEVLFYLIFASMLWVSAQYRFMALAISLTGLVALGILLIPTTAVAITLTSPLLIEFLAGCGIGALFLRHPGGVIRNSLLVLAGFALLAAFGPGTDPGDPWARAVGFGGPAALIVAGAAGLGRHIPPRAILVRLGDASFAIYLFHLFILIPLTAIWNWFPAVHGPMTAILFVVMALVLASALGQLLFDFVEKPLQRWLTQNFLTRFRGSHVVHR